ncbi:MAG: fimbrillin family protein [Rikenellaceae bacterium]|nr:fimbrillin family protein [Rikenellaceae bacterium]
MSFKKYYIWLICIFICVSCTDRSDLEIVGDSENIIIYVEIEELAESKFTPESNLKSHFDDGDAIGVFAVQRSPSAPGIQVYPTTAAAGNYIMYNVKYTYNSSTDSWTTTHSPYIFPSDGTPVDFYAYYPYNATVTTAAQVLYYNAKSKSHEILTSRSINKSKNNKQVVFNFKHKLALIQATIPDDMLYENITVTLLNALYYGPLNLSAPNQANELVPSNAYSNLPMIKSYDGIYRIYVPEQTSIANTPLIVVEEDNDLYYISNPETRTFEGGYAYNFNTTLYKIDDEMANCYIVRPNGSVTIPLARAYTIWLENPELYATNPNLTDEITLKVLWSDTENLITFSTLGSQTTAVATVSGSGREGNAVIGAFIDGQLRWSWHIWVTNYDPKLSHYIYNNGSAEYIFMDRNLGAMSKTPGNISSYGLFYQWGRKYPFPGPATISGTTQNHTTVYGDYNSTLFARVSNQYNLANSINNPTTFYYTYSTNEPEYNSSTNDWYTNDKALQNAYLWENVDGSKTVFDPRPRGWKVPPYRGNRSPWEDFNTSNTQSTSYGILRDGVDYWPAAGVRHFSMTGDFYNTGPAGYYWSATADATSVEQNGAPGAGWFSFGGNISRAFHPRAYGLPVRCVRDLANE